MSSSDRSLILGEFRRVLDDRYRVSLPPEWIEHWGSEKLECMLAKERPGCLSLWRKSDWQVHLEAGIQVVQSKLQAGRLGDRFAEIQTLGRLLSTRQRPVQLAGRGRLLIPEGFREFLAVEPGTEVMVIGAAICVEIWQLEAWRDCLNMEIPQFSRLLDELSR